MDWTCPLTSFLATHGTVTIGFSIYYFKVSPFPHPCSPCTARSSSSSAGQAVQSQMNQPALFPAATRVFSSLLLPKGHCPPADTHAALLGWGALHCSWFQGRTEPWGDMQNIQGVMAAPTWFHLQGEHQHLSWGKGLWHRGVRHTSDRYSTVQDILSAPVREWSCCGSHTFHPHTESRGNTCWKFRNF